jgi:hypothetical protein
VLIDGRRSVQVDERAAPARQRDRGPAIGEEHDAHSFRFRWAMAASSRSKARRVEAFVSRTIQLRPACSIISPAL